jgi:hypothetical protein
VVLFSGRCACHLLALFFVRVLTQATPFDSGHFHSADYLHFFVNCLLIFSIFFYFIITLNLPLYSKCIYPSACNNLVS